MAFRCLTYNIYFEPILMQQRMQALGKLIHHYRPAVIALQEVTLPSWQMLQSQPWFQYYTPSLQTLHPASSAYFVVLLTALPSSEFASVPLIRTGMGRELVYTKIQLNTQQSIVLGTAHLESLPRSAPIRQQQLQQALNVLSDQVKYQDQGENIVGALFMGDMNILPGEMLQSDPSLYHLAHLRVERAKSNRSKCRGCNDKIEKQSVRIARIVIESNRKIEHWYHLQCFLQAPDTPRTKPWPVECITGYAELSELEQQDFRSVFQSSPSCPEMKMNTMGLPTGWTDCWLDVDGNTEENGLTYEGRTNSLIKNKSYNSRFDRLYYYAACPNSRFDSRNVIDLTEADTLNETKGTFRFQSIQRVGMDGLYDHPSGICYNISDHYGLLGNFSIV